MHYKLIIYKLIVFKVASYFMPQKCFTILFVLKKTKVVSVITKPQTLETETNCTIG